MVQAIHVASKALRPNGRYMYPLTCLVIGVWALLARRHHIHFAFVTMKTRSLHVCIVEWRHRSPRCLFSGEIFDD